MVRFVLKALAAIMGIVGAALGNTSGMAVAETTVTVPAPQDLGEHVFNIPSDKSERVGFYLKGWVCLQGDLVAALEDFSIRLQRAGDARRARLLNDPERALRAAGLTIARNPLRVVSAPGQERVSPCFTEAEWSDTLVALRRAALEAPRSLLEGAVPGALLAGSGGGLVWRPGETIPGSPAARPAEGGVLVGGEPLGLLAGSGESDMFYFPVEGGAKKALAGFLVMPDAGGRNGLFLSLARQNAREPPQPVMVEPDGSRLTFVRDPGDGLSLGPFKPPPITISTTPPAPEPKAEELWQLQQDLHAQWESLQAQKEKLWTRIRELSDAGLWGPGRARTRAEHDALYRRWKELHERQKALQERINWVVAEWRRALKRERAAREAAERVRFLHEGLGLDRTGSDPPAAALIEMLRAAMGEADFRAAAQNWLSREDSSLVGFVEYLLRSSRFSGTASELARARRALVDLLTDPDAARLLGISPAKLAAERKRLHDLISMAFRRDYGRSGELETLKAENLARAAEQAMQLARLAGPAERDAAQARYAALVARARVLIEEAENATAQEAEGRLLAIAGALRPLLAARGIGAEAGRLAALVARAEEAAAQRRLILGRGRDAETVQIRRRAAAAYLVAGERAAALRILREIEADDPESQLLLLRLYDEIARLRTRPGAEALDKLALTLPGTGGAAERLAAARRALLERMANGDPRAAATLAATLSLAQLGPEARKAALDVLERIAEAYREDGAPLPPVLRARMLFDEIRDKLMGAASRDTRDAFTRRLSTDPEAALALWFGPFGQGLDHAARRRLGFLVENALQRAIRSETGDPVRRGALIRKLSALLFDMARRAATADPALWGKAATPDAIIEELARLRDNLDYYRRLLPVGERNVLDSILSAMEAMLAETRARQENGWKARSRRADLDYWRDLGMQALARGHVTAAVQVLDRLDVLESDMNAETVAGIRSKLLALSRQVARRKEALWPADRAALDKLIARLTKANREALAKAVAQARDDVVDKIANDAASPDARKNTEARAQLWLRLEAYRRARAAELIAGLEDPASPATFDRLQQLLTEARDKLDAAYRRTRQSALARTGFSKAAQAKDQVILLYLAAERDAIEDVILRLFPERGGAVLNARQERVRWLTRQINAPATAPGGPGVIAELLTSDLPRDHPWRAFMELWGRYLDRRRMQLLLEDPNTDPADSARAYIALLDAERRRWQRERAILAEGPFDLGRSREELVKQSARDMRFRVLPEIVARLAEAEGRGDPQKFMGLLATLLGREMRSALDAYLAYLDTPWARQGLARAYAVFWSDLVNPGYQWNHRVVLGRFREQARRSWRLERALARAAGMSPEELKKTAPADHAALARAGFIVGGRYVIPADFQLRPGTILDEAAAPSWVDEAVSASSLLEDLALVVLPGGIASKGSRAIWDAIGRRMGERWLWLQATGRLGTEAALFTGLGRAGRAVIDPESLLDPRQWTARTLAAEVWHNFLMLGTIGASAKYGDFIAGGARELAPGMLRPEQVWRLPLGRLRQLTDTELKAAMEAATLRILSESIGLTGLGKAQAFTSGEPAPGFFENLVFILKLKALNTPFAPRFADTSPRSLELYELRLAERLRVLDEMARRGFVNRKGLAVMRAWLAGVEKMPVEARVELRRQMMTVLRARVGPAIDGLARRFIGRDPGFGPEVVDLSPRAWKLGELLGKGGFGDVYRHPTQPGQVIKVVRGDALKHGTAREKVTEAVVEAWRSAQREIAGARLLEAAGIAHVPIRRIGAIDAKRPDGRPLRLPVLQKDLVGPGMEVGGKKVAWAQTLRDWIAERGWNGPDGGPKELPPEVQRAIIELARQAARHGLFLGDLKPSNLFVYRVRPDGPLRAGVLEGDGVFRHDRVRELDLFLRGDVPEFPVAVAWELLDSIWGSSTLAVGRAVPGVSYGGLNGWLSPKVLGLMKSGLGGTPHFGPVEFLDLSRKAVMGRELARILENYEQALALEKRIGEFANGAVEEVALKNLLWIYGGQWARATAAYRAGTLSKAQMAALVRIRKRVVDALAYEIVREVYGEERVAREKMWEAVGSENLTSDYDLSFRGERRELCLILFNERFRARWGAAELLGGVEGAGRLDTNAYTAPRYDLGPGGPGDTITQEVAAQLAVRRQLDDAGWAAHRRRVLAGLKGTERMELRAILDRAEAVWARFQIWIANRLEGTGADARTRAANQVYEELMRRLIRLTERHRDTTDPAERARLEQAIREAQWQALFFAAEAYLTEAAIRHIVENTQKAGRRITAELLLSGPGDPARLPQPLDVHKARQSLLEQFAYLVAQIRDGAGFETKPEKARKLAGKVAKYMLRLLDAARFGGIDLRPNEALVRRVVEVEANRGDPEALAKILRGEGDAARFINDARRLAERLVGRIYKTAPLPGTVPTTTSRRQVVSTQLQPQKQKRARLVPLVNSRGVPIGPLVRPDKERDDGRAEMFPFGRLQPEQVEVLKNGVVIRPQRRLIAPPQGRTDTISQIPQRPVHDAGGKLIGYLQLSNLGREMLFDPKGRFLGEARVIGRQVMLGGRVIGALGKAPATARQEENPAESPPEDGGARRVIGRDGREIGRVARDPNGQWSFEPLTPPDILTSPPPPVSVTGDGAVIMGGVVIGRIATAGGGATGTAPTGAIAGPSGSRASGNVAGGAPSGAPVWRELTGPGGRVVGRVQDLGNGEGYLEPVQIPGAMASPPPKVEIDAEGRVWLGGTSVGRVGRRLAPPGDAGAGNEMPGAPPGEEVIGLDGSVIGRAEELPGGRWSFTPEAPPDILVSPAPDVEVTPAGLVLVGGRAIGWLRGRGRETATDLLFHGGHPVLLTVTVMRDETPFGATGKDGTDDTEDTAPAETAGAAPAKRPAEALATLPPEMPKPAEGVYFKLFRGTARVDVSGDEMILTLIEPAIMAGATIPAGTVIMRARREGDQWIGQVMARMSDCPGQDFWADAKLRFDAADPRKASRMSVWTGVPEATGAICTWIPSGRFAGPFAGLRVSAPPAPSVGPSAFGGSAGSRDEPLGEKTLAQEDPLAAVTALLDYAAGVTGAGACEQTRRLLEQQMQVMTSALAALDQVGEASGGVVDLEVTVMQQEMLLTSSMPMLNGLADMLRQCFQAAGLSPP